MSSLRQEMVFDVAGRVTRAEAFRVRCPKCAAPAGAQCIGSRARPNLRLSPHIERMAVCLDMRKEWAP